MKYIKRFEDVYWGSEDVFETDKERNERIKKWVEKYIDDPTLIVNVRDRFISVYYKKSDRWENRKSTGTLRMSKKEAMEQTERDWKDMAEDMVDDMKNDYEEGDLGLDLGNDYVIVASPNGFYVKTEQDLPNSKVGTRSLGGFGG